MLATLTLATVFAGACASPSTSVGTVERREAGWTTRDGWRKVVAADVGEKLGGCAIGRVGSGSRPGIVAVGRSGAVHLVTVDGDGWRREVIARTAGEMIQVAVGDLDRAAPGDEIVVVGKARGTEGEPGEGAAHVLARAPGGGWTVTEIHRAPALLHAVAIGEFDGRPGPDVLVAGYEQHAALLTRHDGGWASEVWAALGAEAKNAIAYRGGAAIALTNGVLLHVRAERPAAGGDAIWRRRELARADAGFARLGVAGERLLAARDDGVLLLLDPDGTTTVFEDDDKLRGAVIADLVPGREGLELATGGYTRRVVVLTAADGGWVARELHRDPERIHHVAAGALGVTDNADEAPCLVAVGYSGRVTVLQSVGE